MTAYLDDVFPPAGHNAIVDALGREPRRALADRLSEVELESQKVLSAEEEGVDGLYFPLSCVICRLVSLPEGTTVKVSLVGREGMTGSSAVFDTSVSAFRTVVQLPGRALFLPRNEARLARWLLLIADRAALDEFPLTHDSLSAMLGVRRESVSVSASELRSAGAIKYRRATVAITDRSELKRHSCSCYPAITDSYARFLKTELREST
jgi:hypothetical protein